MNNVKYDLDLSRETVSDEESPEYENQPRKKLKNDSNLLQKEEETSDEDTSELGQPRYIVKDLKNTETARGQLETSDEEQVCGRAKEQVLSISLDIDIEEEKNFDKLFTRALHIFCNELFEISPENIQEAQSSISEKFQQFNFQGIDFDSTDYLIAYYSRYSTLNACVARKRFFTAFKNCRVLRKTLNNNSLNIISLGGGPGTDMIGFLSAMSSFMKKTRTGLNLTVVDSWKRWESFYNIIQFLMRESEFGNVSQIYQNHDVSSHFMQVDIKNYQQSDRYYMDLHSSDIVLLVRVLNIFEFNEEKRVLKNIVSVMKRGALLLIVDTRDKYKEILDLEILYDFNPPEKCYELTFSPTKKFDLYPATNAKCNIVVCRKK